MHFVSEKDVCQESEGFGEQKEKKKTMRAGNEIERE